MGGHNRLKNNTPEPIMGYEIVRVQYGTDRLLVNHLVVAKVMPAPALTIIGADKGFSTEANEATTHK
jgi:hypothetical protein